MKHKDIASHVVVSKIIEYSVFEFKTCLAVTWNDFHLERKMFLLLLQLRLLPARAASRLTLLPLREMRKIIKITLQVQCPIVRARGCSDAFAEGADRGPWGGIRMFILSTFSVHQPRISIRHRDRL
jgi:hypothetical protein